MVAVFCWRTHRYTTSVSVCNTAVHQHLSSQAVLDTVLDVWITILQEFFVVCLPVGPSEINNQLP